PLGHARFRIFFCAALWAGHFCPASQARAEMPVPGSQTVTPWNFAARSRSLNRSVAVWKRSAGLLASIFSTVPSNRAGIASWYLVGGTGSAGRVFVIISPPAPPPHARPPPSPGATPPPPREE